MSRDKLIERAFPKIRTHYKITSPEDYKYNCIAFAAGDTNKHWCQRHYTVPKEYHLLKI